MGGSGDGGVGSVGTKNNKPSIDAGTSARIQNQAPGDRMKPQAGKPKPDFFDVSRLLPVIDAHGWQEGKRFMKFWIDGSPCTALEDTDDDSKSKGKATITANLANTCMRILTINWDWLLGFTKPKDAYRTFVNDKLFNDAAVKQLIASYVLGKPGVHGKPAAPARVGKIGDDLKDGMKPEDFFKYIEKDQIQSLLVEVDVKPNTIDDEGLAMNNFGYYAMYQGASILVDDIEKNTRDIWPYLDELGLLPPGPYPISPKADAEWIKGLKERWKQYRALLFIKAAYVYAGDIYEFGGFQYLGRWDLKKNTIGGNWVTGGMTWVHNAPDPDADVVDVDNGLFNKYRDKKKMGGDFFAFTPLRRISFKPARMIPVPR